MIWYPFLNVHVVLSWMLLKRVLIDSSSQNSSIFHEELYPLNPLAHSPWVYYSSPVGDVLIPIDETLHPQTHSLMGEPTADCITECPEQPASARESDGGTTSNKGLHFKGTVIFAKSKNMCRYGSVSCKKKMPLTVYALYLSPIWVFESDDFTLTPLICCHND